MNSAICALNSDAHAQLPDWTVGELVAAKLESFGGGCGGAHMLLVGGVLARAS